MKPVLMWLVMCCDKSKPKDYPVASFRDLPRAKQRAKECNVESVRRHGESGPLYYVERASCPAKMESDDPRYHGGMSRYKEMAT